MTTELQAINRTPTGIDKWTPQMGLTPEVKAAIDAQVAQGKVGYNGRFPINQKWSVIAAPPQPGGWVSEVDQSTGETKNVYKEPFAGAYTVIENGTNKNAWHPGIQAYEFNATTGQPNRTFGWSNPDRYTGGEKLTIGMLAAMTGGAAAAAMGGAGAAAGAGNGAFLGEGMASGVPAWDAAATSAGMGLSSPAAAAGATTTMGAGADFGPVLDLPGHELTNSLGELNGLEGSLGGLQDLSPMDLPGHDLSHVTGDFVSPFSSLPPIPPVAPGSGGEPGVPPPPNPFTNGSGGGAPNPFGPGSGGPFDWSSLLGPILAGASGAASAEAAGKAAEAQLQASRESNALLEKMFNKQIELQEPFRQGGISGLNRLTELLGVAGNKDAPDYGSAAKSFTMNDFQADPGYAFQQSEGQKALERSAAARGGLFSGRAMKDTLRFSQGLASQEYGNAFNRFQTERAAKLNPLQSLAGVGQTSANTLTNAAGNYGNAASQNIADAGNARAAGIVGRTNAFNNALGTGYSMYQNQQQTNQNNALMNAIINRGF